MKTIAIVNAKGGTGKTTTAVNLAASFAERGYETLLIDLDPKSDATISCQTRPDTLSVANGLGEIAARYAYVVIDTPPELGEITNKALSVADLVIVPTDTGMFSLRAASQCLHFIEENYKDLSVWCLSTLFKPRTRFGRDCREELGKLFGNHLFETRIHTTVKIQEAQATGQPITLYARDSRGFTDYHSFTEEVLKKALSTSKARPKAFSSYTEDSDHDKPKGVDLDEFDRLTQDL